MIMCDNDTSSITLIDSSCTTISSTSPTSLTALVLIQEQPGSNNNNVNSNDSKQEEEKQGEGEITKTSITSEEILQQTTQSLIMASSLMLDTLGLGSMDEVTNGKDSKPRACNFLSGSGSKNSATAILNIAAGSGAHSSCIIDSDLYGSTESILQMLHSIDLVQATPVNAIKINVDELLRENLALKEKLKEMITIRDRLLCEVSNLRLELDKTELKRIPEEGFPQKSLERNDSTQCGASGTDSVSTFFPEDGGGGVGGSLNAGGGNYVYLQQHYAPSTLSSNTSSINYITAAPHVACVGQSSQFVYHQQQLQQEQATCHQLQYMHQQQPTNIGAVSGGLHHRYSQQNINHQMHHPHHHLHHVLHDSSAGSGVGVSHHHHHHSGLGTGGIIVKAGPANSLIATNSIMGVGSTKFHAAAALMQQNLHRKNSVRPNVDVLKRSRAQTAYELSQDLLEKQIELLERKYGGIRARNAAITIQRAFRHYMMVKKFASITAMAKAEKRLSRRMLIGGTSSAGAHEDNLPSAYSSVMESHLQQHHMQQSHQQLQARVTVMAGPPQISSGGIVANSSVARTPPTRSLSMRERRHLDGSPIPRSQSGSCNNSISNSSSNTLGSSAGNNSVQAHHPHVNLLHATEGHYYSTVAAAAAASQQLSYYNASYHNAGGSSSSASSSLFHDTSYTSSQINLDTSLNASWVNSGGATSGASNSSPHTPYYSAAQIYMRPKGMNATATPLPGVATSNNNNNNKKVPPEVPKRTSSITTQQQQQQQLMLRQTPPPGAGSMLRPANGLSKTAENGSLTSVQSSGSDSSVTSTERVLMNSDFSSDRSNSPLVHSWKRGNHLNSSQQCHNSEQLNPSFTINSAQQHQQATTITAMIGTGGLMASSTADDHHGMTHTSAAQYEQQQQHQHELPHEPVANVNASNAAVTAGAVAVNSQNYKVSETIRKRQYRVGLNLFNKKPEKGITYLIRRGFLENTPPGVARFLISRKGLSRQLIGEYLGNLQNPFNMAVLNCFAMELDLSGMQVDVALRKFQTYFRMPGEAQKIERLMEIFSQRYCQCNQDVVGRLRSSDTIFVLAFAIIMLNTDLHTPNLKPERRMRVEDFIKNLRGIDDCHDIDRDMLLGIYERVKANEFKPGSDHVTQVMKVQATIVGKKPNLALPHRRLVCYCRLYEIPDVNKKERPGVHQREVFLFNDLLVITKIFSKKKSSVTYTFRNSYPLCGMVVSLLDVQNYSFCIQLSQKVDGKILITFNARNEHDRCKFAEDLKESISEMDEMEALRIEAELERQKSARNRTVNNTENRDSGVADVEVCSYQSGNSVAAKGKELNKTTKAKAIDGIVGGDIGAGGTFCGGPECNAENAAASSSIPSTQYLKRSALSNSLLDIHEQFGNEKPQRRGSVGSLDSGMSISFQSTATSSASRENAALIVAAANAAAAGKIRFPMPTAMNAVYTAAPSGMQPQQFGVAYIPQTQAILLQQQQQKTHLHQQQQPQQVHVNVQHQQQPVITGRKPGRERKASKSEESGRSTDV